MIPTPNCRYECKKCGKKLTAHQEEEFPQLVAAPPKCPQCGGEMMVKPMIHLPKNPFKKH